MRILFLNYEYPPLGGGAGNATEYLMREFSKDPALEVDLVVSSVDDVYHEERLSDRVRLLRLPIGDKRKDLKKQSSKDLIVYAWKAFWFCRKLMREKRYDGIHAFFTVPCGAVAWQLGKQFRVPYVVSLRGSDVPGYSKKYEKLYFFIKPLVKIIWRSAVSVVSNSEGLKQLALETNKEQKIGVIYNGVDIEKFTPRREEKSNTLFTVLCASRLERRKGFRYVVEAVSKLVDRYPNLRLTLAGGDGNAGEELRTMVSEKNLSEKVTFFGQYSREDLVSLQQKSDVFVLPSFNEGMSNSLLEAMAGGLPVLMTPTGGAEELITDGENGYAIPFADPEGIVEKLETLLKDGELVNRMGQKSRTIAEPMSWGAVAKEHGLLYEKVFQKKLF